MLPLLLPEMPLLELLLALRPPELLPLAVPLPSLPELLHAVPEPSAAAPARTPTKPTLIKRLTMATKRRGLCRATQRKIMVDAHWTLFGFR